MVVVKKKNKSINFLLDWTRFIYTKEINVKEAILILAFVLFFLLFFSIRAFPRASFFLENVLKLNENCFLREFCFLLSFKMNSL